jgi:hypothetical protein
MKWHRPFWFVVFLFLVLRPCADAQSGCDPAPSGLVSWWPGNGNALDIQGGNNGTLENSATFAPGEVAEAFSFNGQNQYVQIADSPSLRPLSVTLECWFNASNTAGGELISKPVGSGTNDSYDLWLQSGNLNGAVGNNGAQEVLSYPFTPVPGVWNHAAYTFDNDTQVQTLYFNGEVVAAGFANIQIGYDSNPVLIGTEFDDGSPGLPWTGEIDEVSVYDRALYFTEIQAIYQAGGAGKCTNELPPVIITQATSQIVTEGNPVTFTVSANGTAPLAYQWLYNLTILTDNAQVTGSQSNILTLTSANIANSGTYQIVVTNAYGSANALATLIVQATPMVTWANPLPIFYGSPLTSNQLNATADVPGSFAYKPNIGAVLNGGTNTLSVIFTPIDTIDYTSATNTVSLLVVPAVPLVIWTNPAPITYGTPLTYGASDPGCDPPPSGLVSWWPGNGNTLDIEGTNNGTAEGNLTYAAGEVGQAFSLDGSSAYVLCPASTTLNVGAGSGMTIECWINPGGVGSPQPLVEWNNGSSIGAHFWIGQAAGDLYANLIDTGGTYHTVFSPQGILSPNTFQHVALTYDKASGIATQYLNGAVVTTQNVGVFTPQTSYNFYLGRRPNAQYYGGLLDEVSLYSRALSSTEIQGIYEAGSAGKCTNSGQLSATATVPGSFAYNPPSGNVLNAGTNTLSVLFTPTDTVDYASVTDSVSLVVSPTPLTVTALNVTWLVGQSFPVFTDIITGLVNGDNITATNSCSATPNSPAGPYSIVPSLVDPDDRQTNYTVTLLNGTLTVQRTPVIAWTNPAPITYGTALTSNQLNATASVPGSFAYNPPSGNVLNAGTNTLSVLFTPTDTIDYTSATNSVSLVVSPAPLTVTAVNVSRPYDQINPVFTGTIIGVQNDDNITAFYSCSATTNSPAGAYAITPALVDPGNRQTNYTVTMVNGTFTITPAVPVLAWTNPDPITYGTTLSSNELNATANMPGSLAYTPTNGSVLNVGTNALSVVFTPTDTVDYSSVTGTVSLVVSPVPLTVTAASTSRPYGQINPVFTDIITGLVNGDNITATNSCGATTSSPVGTYSIVPALVDPEDRQTNYTVTLINGTLTVEPLPIILTEPQSQTVLVGTNVTFTVTATNAPPVLPVVTSGTLQLWLEADAGVVTNSAGFVSQWQDQSGNANTALQETANLQPTLVSASGLGGEPAVRFNGIQDGVHGSYMSGSGLVNVPNAMTSFAVYNAFSTTNTENMIWDIGVPGQGSANRADDIALGDLYFTFWNENYFTSFVVPTNTYRIWTTRLDTNLDTLNMFDATADTETNFTLSVSGAVTPAAGYYLGGAGLSRNFNGDIAELIFYQGYLTEADRLAVTSYLEQKYYQTGSAGGLNYQWQFNGTNLPLATNSALALPSVSLNQEGSYQVVVTGTYGSVTSSPAMLEVRPIFVSANGSLLTGTNYTFIGPTTISLVTGFTNGSIYYTLNGSQPSFSTAYYPSPITVRQSGLLQAVAYSADFSQYGAMPPIAITIIPVYGINYLPSFGGSVSASPSNSPYVTGSLVNLQATPNEGWMFLYWLGDGSGGDTNFTLTMDSDKTVQAVFGTTLGETVSGNGTVSVNPSSSLYPYGATVRLTANPASGYAFGTWGDAAAGISTNPLYFTITNTTPIISALFTSLPGNRASLTIQTSGNGQVRANPLANSYALNSIVALTAIPQPGQQFLGWSGNASGGSTNFSLTMSQSETVTATFSQAPILSVAAPLNGLFNSGFRLTITSDFGAICDLEASTNLPNWYSLITLTNTYGTVQFTDPAATTNNATFYRLLLSP